MAKKSKPITEPVTEIETTKPETTQTKGTKMSSHDDSILHLDQNLADYADFAPLPKGPYPAEVREAESRTSDKGNDYYYVVFHIDTNDYPADYDVANNPEGTRLVYARVQKPDAKNRRSITAVKNFLRALGYDLSKVSTIDPSEWIGKKAKLMVDVGEYNGTPNNSIASVEALD